MDNLFHIVSSILKFKSYIFSASQDLYLLKLQKFFIEGIHIISCNFGASVLKANMAAIVHLLQHSWQAWWQILLETDSEKAGSFSMTSTWRSGMIYLLFVCGRSRDSLELMQWTFRREIIFTLVGETHVVYSAVSDETRQVGVKLGEPSFLW